MTMADNDVYAGGLLNPIAMHLIFKRIFNVNHDPSSHTLSAIELYVNIRSIKDNGLLIYFVIQAHQQTVFFCTHSDVPTYEWWNNLAFL